MPQLMPLNWIFSSMMIFVLMISMMVIYSEKMTMLGFNKKVNKYSINKIWCW